MLFLIIAKMFNVFSLNFNSSFTLKSAQSDENVNQFFT